MKDEIVLNTTEGTRKHLDNLSAEQVYDCIEVLKRCGFHLIALTKERNDAEQKKAAARSYGDLDSVKLVVEIVESVVNGTY